MQSEKFYIFPSHEIAAEVIKGDEYPKTIELKLDLLAIYQSYSIESIITNNHRQRDNYFIY
jgi:hypothetical protein